MATPCDALRTQAEARLQQLARRVTAHRKVKNYEEAEEALKVAQENCDNLREVRIV